MRKAFVILGLLVLAVLPFGVFAQTEQAPRLSPGTPVTGSLDAENFAETYILTGSAGNTITLIATTESEELTLALLLTDPNGTIVAQDSDLNTPGEAAINNFALPENGTYQLTVLRGNGASGEESGDYTLNLTGTLVAPQAAVPTAETNATAPTVPGVTSTPIPNVELTEGGISIGLGWTAAVNFDLEVRDPVGGMIFNTSPTSTSGGTFSADANADCTTATADNPSEGISWQPGSVPAGSYEILIYYIDGCTVTGPQEFSLIGTVNNETPQVIRGTLNPGQEYLASVTLTPEGDWTLNNGGVNAGLNVTLLSPQIQAATPLVGTSATGNINRERPAVAYTFSGTANSTVNISLDRTSGSLDPYLLLLNANGSEVASNDDRADGNINSTISATLPTTGSYTIVATRYGQTIGGTEGDFALTVSTANPVAAQATPLPGATTAALPTTAPTAALLTDASGAALPDGNIEVRLTWNTLADLQLQVRDPFGATVFDDTPSVGSGGILAADGNVGCTGVAGVPGVSYIYWPTTRIPPGLYEVEVWYQDTCNDPTPVIFDLNINVGGQEIVSFQESILTDSRFMVTFSVDTEGTATAGPSGTFDMDVLSIDYASALPDAVQIAYGNIVPGNITEGERFQVYTFQGQIGDTIRIGMNRTSNTLDTAVYLLDENGIQLAYNDDTPNQIGTTRDTNSVIETYTLTTTGRYYIIATHYGQAFGGTIGTYNLALLRTG